MEDVDNKVALLKTNVASLESAQAVANQKKAALDQALLNLSYTKIYAPANGIVGSYTVDSEGVKAQPVNVIENGTLSNYLLGRQPLRDFPLSNGHGRSAPGSSPSPNLGVLLVKSSEAQSPDALRQRVVQMVTDQGKPYGYRVDTMGGIAPRLLYRVYAKDGHEELVRGAVFSELDVRALRSDLVAVGNDPLVSNRTGGISSTIISPSLLFDELEVKRADTSKDKLPDYPPPPLEKK